jgi:hypothetical protein
MLLAAALWTAAAPLLLAASDGKKQPVPSEAAQAQAMNLVKEVFGADYAKATSLEAKQALAKTLLEKARATRDNLTDRFVLLKLCRDIATQGLDGLTAFQAVDAIAESFEIDPVEMKAAVLKHGATRATSPLQHKRLMQVALWLVDAAIAEDNYVVAKQLCELAAAEATAAGDASTKGLAIKLAADVENVLAALYEKAQNAAAMLNADPVNPEANAAFGKYLCFVKGDWDRGILMLALGGDPALKALAQKELEELSPPPPEQIGDDWWTLAEKEDGAIKKQGQARAGYWYRTALPRLSGLSKERVAKRLESIGEQPSPSASPAPPAAKKPSLPEHNTWTIPYTWSEQVQKNRTVNEFSPQTGHVQRKIPYTDTVHHSGTKNVQAKLVSYDYKLGTVVLKIAGEKKNEEIARSFRYAALGKDDKKYLDDVRKQLTEEK